MRHIQYLHTNQRRLLLENMLQGLKTKMQRFALKFRVCLNEKTNAVRRQKTSWLNSRSTQSKTSKGRKAFYLPVSSTQVKTKKLICFSSCLKGRESKNRGSMMMGFDLAQPGNVVFWLFLVFYTDKKTFAVWQTDRWLSRRFIFCARQGRRSPAGTQTHTRASARSHAHTPILIHNEPLEE